MVIIYYIIAIFYQKHDVYNILLMCISIMLVVYLFLLSNQNEYIDHMNILAIKKFTLTYIPCGSLIWKIARRMKNIYDPILYTYKKYKLLYILIKIYLFNFNNMHESNYLRFCEHFLKIKHDYLKNILTKSTSQLGNELFVLSELDFKNNGYFVEFGIADGITVSNTYFLEKYLNWQGIVAEPARLHHHKLKENRACNIDTRCVWKKSGKILDFHETAEPYCSTLANYTDCDSWREERKNYISYKVETVTLLDLLEAHNAPRVVDYIAINTQGSEFEILKAFDFTMYDIKIITVGHNYADYKNDIYNLLVSQGYKQVYKEHSEWQDWYVKI